MTVHRLKCWPPFFGHVLDGSKPFEVRRDDRRYEIGDVLVLLEYDPTAQRHTGRKCRRTVTYMLRGGAFGLGDGYVALGLAVPR